MHKILYATDIRSDAQFNLNDKSLVWFGDKFPTFIPIPSKAFYNNKQAYDEDPRCYILSYFLGICCNPTYSYAIGNYNSIPYLIKR